MANPLLLLSKHKKSGRKPSGTSKKLVRTAKDEEKAAKHRKASREHYERNPHIREKNRLHAADVRYANKKARRRQWDPPKANKLAAIDAVAEESRSASSLPLQCAPSADNPRLSTPPEPDPRGQTDDILELLGPALLEDDEQRVLLKQKTARNSQRGADCGSAGSLTPAEHAAMEALAAMASPGLRLSHPWKEMCWRVPRLIDLEARRQRHFNRCSYGWVRACATQAPRFWHSTPVHSPSRLGLIANFGFALGNRPRGISDRRRGLGGITVAQADLGARSRRRVHVRLYWVQRGCSGMICGNLRWTFHQSRSHVSYIISRL
ncbi:hypothetical protein B0H17DRAFT_1139519 [Mycena rosella]|uniref:Uncharacterized protein n=1 Tax=Mycena rosella TaxID=1033263 RepID=A0AAD7GB43_MYCRO|nr:hypothetical protein B0H17DRAFT_1139519 [Mycena rosella]